MKLWSRPKKIGSIFAFLLSGAALLLTIILVLLIGVVATDELKRSIGEGLAERATHATALLDTMMYERYREVHNLAQRAELGSPTLTPAHKRAVLEQLQRSYPLYSWMGITDTAGVVTAATGGMLEGVNVAQRNWFVDATNQVYVHDVHDAKLLAKMLPLDEGNPQRFVDVAFPYFHPDGKLAGVLGTHLSWRWSRQVQDLFSSRAERGVQTFILSRDGVVLSGPKDWVGKPLRSQGAAQGQRQQAGYLEEDWSDGRQYIVGYSRTRGYSDYPGLDWTILIRQETVLAYESVRTLQARVLAVGLAVALVFCLLGIYLARRLTDALQRIVARASAEEDDAAAQRPALTGYVELDGVSGALYTLLDQARLKRELLTGTNAELEARVSQRTAELEQSLQSVRASEERIRSILDTAQDAFVGMDHDGNVIDWNPQAEAMFGWSRSEVLGRPLRDIIIPHAMRRAHDEGMQRFQHTGEHHVLGRRLQLSALRRSGEEFPVELTIGHVDGSEHPSYGAFINDISQRVRIEQELEAERVLLRAVLESIDIGVMACDQDGHLSLFNRASRELHGISQTDLPQEEWARHYALFEADERTPVPPERVPLVRAFQGEEVRDAEIVVAAGRQPPRHLLVSGRRLWRDDGSSLGAVVMLVDVTERQEAQRKLAESERFLRAVTDNSPALIGYVDAGGIYRFANKAYETMLGLVPEAIIGLHIRDVVGPDNYAEIVPHVAAALGGARQHFEITLCHPGWPSYVMVSYIPELGDGGAVAGFHVMITDISSRKEAELAQASSERAASAANRAKSAFLANMSHEIRTPMNAVLGLAHLLARTGLSRQQADFVEKIRACGQSLLHIINDILDSSKIEAGKIDMAQQPFTVAEVAGVIATAMQAYPEQRDVDYILDVAPDIPPLIGDPMRLQQVLLNLVSNAIKFTEHGEIVLAVRSTPLDADRLLLEISISDTGIGMSAEHLGRVFAPFEQADVSTSRRFGGTGLGLSIVSQLIELMQGSVTVDSVQGQGSRFQLAIPFPIDHAALPLPLPLPEAEAEAEAEADQPLSILLVDGDAASAAAVRHTVAALGWTCTTAATTQQALALRGDWQAVVVAGATWLAASEDTLRALGREGALPLIPMLNAAQRAQPAAERHAAAVLERPVLPAALADTVRGILAQLRGEVGVVAPPPPAARLRGMRILLAEDNALNQLIARGMLEPLGAELTVANNGQEAVDLLNADPLRADIVLMDVQMPVMDGYEATRRIRSMGLPLPVLAMSAGVMESERAECEAAGMNGFIAKPVEYEQMLEAIVRSVDRARRPS